MDEALTPAPAAPAPAGQDKGGPAPAPAGQPVGQPQGNEGGGGNPAPTPSGDDEGQDSLLSLLGLDKQPEPQKPQQQAPESQAYQALLQERDKYKALAEEVQERRKTQAVIEQVIDGLDEAFDKDEVRAQLGLVAPVIRSVVEELTGAYEQQLSALSKRLDAAESRADESSWKAGEQAIGEKIKELGALTGSGIEKFIGPELDQAVAARFKQMGSPKGWDSDEGYLRIALMVNSELIAAKARRERDATARQEHAEARKVPGGRSSRTPSGVSISDLRGKSLEEQRRILTERSRSRRS